MRIKSYFTNTVEAAVSLARVELGSEALLVSVRRTTEETKAYWNYEVVFGLAAPDKGPATTAAPIEPRPAQIPPPPPVRETIAPPAKATPCFTFGESEVEAKPVVRPERALAAAAAPVHSVSTPRFSFSESEVERRPLDKSELDSRFEIATTALLNPRQRCIAALVGPHGAGKTTTLVKLAVLHGLAAGRRVEIISLDTRRIGATEALRSYATALNVGFYPLDNPALLTHAIEDVIEPDNLILIDTPGFAKNTADLADLTGALSRRTDIETHLVVPATLAQRELRVAVDRFSSLKPVSLLFTRTDEAASLSRIVNESFRSRIPLSFFSTGPEIPEDLEIVNKQALVDRVAGRRCEEATAA